MQNQYTKCTNFILFICVFMYKLYKRFSAGRVLVYYFTVLNFPCISAYYVTVSKMLLLLFYRCYYVTVLLSSILLFYRLILMFSDILLCCGYCYFTISFFIHFIMLPFHSLLFICSAIILRFNYFTVLIL